jgi:hypothetical protein
MKNNMKHELFYKYWEINSLSKVNEEVMYSIPTFALPNPMLKI